jgi:hypothetical protein
VEFGFGKAESVSTPVVHGQKPVVQSAGLTRLTINRVVKQRQAAGFIQTP